MVSDQHISRFKEQLMATMSDFHKAVNNSNALSLSFSVVDNTFSLDETLNWKDDRRNKSDELTNNSTETSRIHYNTSGDCWRTDRNSQFVPRIAYITFCHLNGTSRFEQMVISAVETWMPPTEKYFVVLADIWKENYDNWIGRNESLSNRIEPIFVDCPEGMTLEAACCKMEKGLLAFMGRGYLDQYDWFFYADDDVYVRKAYLEDYVATIPNISHPFVLASGGTRLRTGVPRNRCSKEPSFTYMWGNPAVYSRGAMERMRRGLELGGLVKQCVEFGVTHDVGNALLNWMYSLDALWMRTRDRPNSVRAWDVAVHGIGRCRKISCPMHEVHGRVAPMQDPNRSEYQYFWHTVDGFHSTSTYQKYGDPWTWTTEWHTMPVADCKVGTAGKNKVLTISESPQPVSDNPVAAAAAGTTHVGESRGVFEGCHGADSSWVGIGWIGEAVCGVWCNARRGERAVELDVFVRYGMDSYSGSSRLCEALGCGGSRHRKVSQVLMPDGRGPSTGRNNKGSQTIGVHVPVAHCGWFPFDLHVSKVRRPVDMDNRMAYHACGRLPGWQCREQKSVNYLRKPAASQ